MSMSPVIARAIGRPGLAAGRGSVSATGQGRVYDAGGRGATAVGLSSQARFGNAAASFNFGTGELSTLMIGGLVVVFALFYMNTRSAQA